MKLTGGTDWPGGWTHDIGRQTAHVRKRRGISAEALGRMCADLGFPIPRNTIMNLEHGRKESIPVHEVVIIAAALGVPATELLFPPNEFAQYLPERRLTSYEAVEEFTGFSPEPTTWAETLGRLLTDDEGTALLNTVKVMRKVGA